MSPKHYKSLSTTGKSLLALSSIALMSQNSYGQSLFADDPSESVDKSLPLKYTLTAGVGYDDHFTANANTTSVGSAYVSAALGADYVNYTPKTNWKIGAYLSANKYLKNNGSSGDDVYYNARLNLGLNHRITSRMRYVMNTYLNYGIEPDYSFSFSPNRAPSEHLYYSTDHAIGYRWTSRLATYTGFRVNGVDYHGSGTSKDGNRRTFGFYNNFRYSTGPNTTLTTGLSYNKTEASGSARDSTDLTGHIGIEHRMSQSSFVNAQIGATRREIDGGNSYSSPYAELTFNTRINPNLSWKSYGRYGIENFATSQGNVRFDNNHAVRIGSELNYAMSSKFSLYGGVNYIRYNYSEGTNILTNAQAGDSDQDIINPYFGVRYNINDNTYLNASYHYTSSATSVPNSNTEYDRNRFQLNVNRTF